jgi:hypothetical protein
VVSLIFVADANHFIPFSKTPFLLGFAWISLRVRNFRWRDVGFSRYKSWAKTLGFGLAAEVALEIFQLFIGSCWIFVGSNLSTKRVQPCCADHRARNY